MENGMASMRFAPDFFPLMPWGKLPPSDTPRLDEESGLASMAACRFSMSCFVQPDRLRRCEELRLKAIVYPTAGGSTRWERAWRDLPEQEIRERIRALVEEAGASEAILGYYLVDEPSVLDFPALAHAVRAVEAFAPGKLAYINLFPDYATLGAPDMSQLGVDSYTEYLERYVAEVRPHFISYDNYCVLHSDDLRIPQRAASYYRNLLEVRRVADKHGLPFWNIVSSNQIRPFTPVPSPANLAFQAYTTLAAGARGLSWFTYYQLGYDYAPIDAHNHRTETWRYLQAVNHQMRTLGPLMNRMHSTGVFFTTPPPAEGLPVLPGRLVETIAADTPMMVGEFVHQDGSDYVMVVNLSLERSAKFTFMASAEINPPQIISSEDGRFVPFDVEKGLWLVAGQGALIRL